MENNTIKLTYEQNLRAAIVFLNMFNLTIEEKENLCYSSDLKIISSDSEVLGKIHLEEEKIIINTQTDLGLLEASYQTINASRSFDVEYQATHTSWNFDINYTIHKNNDEKFTGLFYVDIVADTQFGTHCICRPILDYIIKDKKVMSLKFQLDGSTFKAEFWDDDFYEVINFMPFDSLNGYIIHDIKEGKYENSCYPYRKYSGIFSFSELEKNKFKAFSITYEYGNISDNKVIPYEKENYKEGSWSDSRETIMQFGNTMQEFNPSTYDKIKKIKALLTEKNTSLLDYFINVSLGSFNDEEIKALLGIERKPLEYKGKVKELKQIYFGDDVSSKK